MSKYLTTIFAVFDITFKLDALFSNPIPIILVSCADRCQVCNISDILWGINIDATTNLDSKSYSFMVVLGSVLEPGNDSILSDIINSVGCFNIERILPSESSI